MAEHHPHPMARSRDRHGAGHAAHGGSEGRALTRLAISATLHCLTGCAIGEVLGMVIGTALGWAGPTAPRSRSPSRWRSSSATR